MKQVTIITDSSSCLTRELIKRYGVVVVPVEMEVDGRVRRDGVDITPTEVYQLLARTKNPPTTSAPSPGIFFEVLQSLGRSPRSVLIITVSAEFSGTYQSAAAAAEMSRQQLPHLAVEVLDSRTAAGAQGLVVLAAARSADAGHRMPEVIEAARTVMSSVHLVAFLDTLHYLGKTGRVPAVAAWGADLLQIKPVVHLGPGNSKPSLLRRVRTRQAAMEQLLKETHRLNDSRKLHVVVMHSDSPADAEEIRKRVAAEFTCAETHVCDFTPVMGVHTGPGLLGVAFYGG